MPTFQSLDELIANKAEEFADQIKAGTCPCRPVSRGLPSSVKQLRATQPCGLSRSWRTFARSSGANLTRAK